MLGPTSARRRAKLSAPKIVSPGCSSRQMRSPGAAVAGPRRELAPEGHDVLAELPLPERLVVAAQPGHGEHAGRVARAAAARAAAHRHDRVDAEQRGQLDRPAQRRLGLGARGRSGRQRVARRVDAGQALAVLAQLALQPVTLGGLGQEPREVEVGARRPRADAHLQILDPTRGTPLQRLAPFQVSQAVGEQADPQRALFGTILERSNKGPIEAIAHGVVKAAKLFRRARGRDGRRRSAAPHRRARPRPG